MGEPGPAEREGVGLRVDRHPAPPQGHGLEEKMITLPRGGTVNKMKGSSS